jgi:hypothetical protein
MDAVQKSVIAPEVIRHVKQQIEKTEKHLPILRDLCRSGSNLLETFFSERNIRPHHQMRPRGFRPEHKLFGIEPIDNRDPAS